MIERDIVLLANIMLKCVWDSGTESGRNRSRLVDQEVEVNFKSGKLEYSSRYSRNLASVVLDQTWMQKNIKTRTEMYTETEIIHNAICHDNNI